MKRFCFTVCLISCFVVKIAFGATLVRMEFQLGTAPAEIVDLKLYDDIAPLTVSNFLSYVKSTTSNGGDYANAFIHRIDPGFIVQGGGYTFDPWLNLGSFDTTDGLFLGGLQIVPADPVITNEYNQSNVTGTIAMALDSTGNIVDINSAKSQWFINLADNSAILDPQSFTVFGEVLGGGMTVFDSMEAVPLYDKSDIYTFFDELPLVNYSSGEPVEANLVRQTSISELLSITSDIDFSMLVTGTSAVESVITITNLMVDDLSIGNIADTDVLSSPFSIVAGTDSCSNVVVPALGSCNFTVQFIPVVTNVFMDAFNIEFSSLSLSYIFSLTGVGPDIRLSLPTLDYGEQQIYDAASGFPEQRVQYVYNDGNADLHITSITLEGANAADFELFDNCTGFSASVVKPGEFCVLPVNFLPSTIGNKEATLTVITDDADEAVIVIPITGSVSVDLDGIPADIEDASPNAGDGNNDDILDSVQSSVTSMPGRGGEYITLATENGFISAISIFPDSLLEMPQDIEFGSGVINLNIDDVSSSIFRTIMILPEGMDAESYYLYGPTPDNGTPHWYDFTFDGTTGAQMLGEVAIESPTGSIIYRNIVVLFFKDGERGDIDLIVNGSIASIGGHVVGAAPDSLSDSSGSMSVLGIYLFLLILFSSRVYCRN